MKTRIAFILILVLTLSACKTRVLGVEIGFQTPTAQPPATATAPPSQAENQPPPTPLEATAPARGLVCFDERLSEGTLRVRQCPGLTCAEVTVIASGTQILFTGERRDADDVTWLHISSPVNGWVSSKFICNEGR